MTTSSADTPDKDRFPARLHVLLARDARTAVILRRGPSRHVAAIGWDRRNDSFELGQWLKGRIYERRADLSPDGQHLIYFAMNGRWQSETGGSWTAISRAPYLRAQILLGKGDCWHGGGLFTGNRSYWLNDGYGHKLMRETSKLKRDTTWNPATHFGGECPGVYYNRLIRDGWTLRERKRGDDVAVFEKPLRDGWLLRKRAHAQIDAPPGRGCYWDEHELEHADQQLLIPCPDWEWAEQDGRTLVYARGGALYRTALPRGEQLADPRLLADFNDWRFEARAAPYR